MFILNHDTSCTADLVFSLTLLYLKHLLLTKKKYPKQLTLSHLFDSDIICPPSEDIFENFTSIFQRA